MSDDEQSGLHVPDDIKPSPTTDYIRMVDLRQFLIRLRQSRIIELGALEDFLGMKRSITPKKKR